MRDQAKTKHSNERLKLYLSLDYCKKTCTYDNVLCACKVRSEIWRSPSRLIEHTIIRVHLKTISMTYEILKFEVGSHRISMAANKTDHTCYDASDWPLCL